MWMVVLPAEEKFDKEEGRPARVFNDSDDAAYCAIINDGVLYEVGEPLSVHINVGPMSGSCGE